MAKPGVMLRTMPDQAHQAFAECEWSVKLTINCGVKYRGTNNGNSDTERPSGECEAGIR